MRAVIVGSGPSAKGFTPPDGVFVIAVNGVADWVAHADAWFSLDASAANQRRLAERRLKNCVYVTCGPNWPRRGDRHFDRVDSLKTRPRLPPQPAGSPEWWFWRYACVAGICAAPDTINTGNSAWGALGLAWHLGLRDVALIGVDADAGPRCEGGHSDNLTHLPMLFASATHSFDRLACCGNMQAPGVPCMEWEEWLCR